MIKLIGSEKQVKWAMEIRENLLKQDIDIERLRGKVQRRNKTMFKKGKAECETLTESQIDQIVSNGLELFKTANSASFWIDVRNDRIVAIINDLCFHSVEMESHV